MGTHIFQLKLSLALNLLFCICCLLVLVRQMNQLLTVLHRIQEETGFNPRGRKVEKKGRTSEFSRNRKKISTQIKNIRKSLDERDELLGKKAATKSTVILSADIRHQIKMVKKDATAMQSAQQKRTELLKKKRWMKLLIWLGNILKSAKCSKRVVTAEIICW